MFLTNVAALVNLYEIK